MATSFGDQTIDCVTTEQCLTAILGVGPALFPAVVAELKAQLGGQFSIPSLNGGNGDAERLSKKLTPYMCGEKPLPDAVDYEGLIQKEFDDNAQRAKNSVSDPVGKAVTDTVVDYFGASIEEGLDQPNRMFETISSFRQKVHLLICAAHAHDKGLSAFLTGEEAIGRIVRAVYTPDELRKMIRYPLSHLTDLKSLVQMFRPMAQADGFKGTPEQIDAALAKICAPLVNPMIQKLDAAVSAVVNRMYAH